MNIPNLLTGFRIILVPVYLYTFFKAGKNKLLLSGLVFLLAGVTDVLDGYIARKYNKTTKLGAILDPLADKLMTFAVLISFTIDGIIPSWILTTIGAKELAMILGAAILYLFRGNRVLPANRYGKMATFTFYIAIATVVLGFPETYRALAFKITVLLNIIAFVNYLIIFIRADRGSNNMI